MTKRTGRIAGAEPSSARGAREQEEVSRVIRISPMLVSLREPAQSERFGARSEVWVALAVVAAASSATSYAAAWMLARWLLS